MTKKSSAFRLGRINKPICIFALTLFASAISAQEYAGAAGPREREQIDATASESQLIGRVIWFYYDNAKCFSSSFPFLSAEPVTSASKEYRATSATKMLITRLLQDRYGTRYLELKVDNGPNVYMLASAAWRVGYNEGVSKRYCASFLSPEDIADASKQAAQKNTDELAAARVVQQARADDFKRFLDASNHRDTHEQAMAAKRAKLPAAKVGMTTVDVVNATNWGQPKQINKTTTAAGTDEQWVYGDGNYLYFRNGILVVIQN